MKRWKKIALVLLGLLLLSQAPFAYRRYRLRRLSAAIAELNAGRAPAPADDPFEDYEGVFHVHSSLGGHSTGTLEEVVRAAKSDGLAFVIMTEHPSALVNTSEATLRGTHEGVLFLPGSELAASDGGRVFAVPGFESPDSSLSLHDLAARASGEGRLAVLGYPEQMRELRPEGFDAVEVYNLYTNSKRINYALLFFDGLWSYFPYADLLFTDFYERPDANLRRWDEANAAGQRLFAVAGNDAHQNVGISLQEQTGNKLLDIKLDPYERSFRVVRNHVLIEKGQPLDADSLLKALRSGHSYFAFDLFGDCSVRLAFTPGHTAGHCSVICRLARTDFVIGGDAVYMLGQLENREPLPGHAVLSRVQAPRLRRGILHATVSLVARPAFMSDRQNMSVGVSADPHALNGGRSMRRATRRRPLGTTVHRAQSRASIRNVPASQEISFETRS